MSERLNVPENYNQIFELLTSQEKTPYIMALRKYDTSCAHRMEILRRVANEQQVSKDEIERAAYEEVAAFTECVDAALRDDENFDGEDAESVIITLLAAGEIDRQRKMVDIIRGSVDLECEADELGVSATTSTIFGEIAERDDYNKGETASAFTQYYDEAVENELAQFCACIEEAKGGEWDDE